MSSLPQQLMPSWPDPEFHASSLYFVIQHPVEPRASYLNGRMNEALILF